MRGKIGRGLRQRVTVALALTFAASLLVAAPLVVPNPWVWQHVDTATVSDAGRPTRQVGVYRSTGSRLIVFVSPGEGPYLVYPDVKRIQLLSNGGFFRLPGRVVFRTSHPRGLDLDSPKMDYDPEIVAAPGGMTFTALSGARVEIRRYGMP